MADKLVTLIISSIVAKMCEFLQQYRTENTITEHNLKLNTGSKLASDNIIYQQIDDNYPSLAREGFPDD